MKSVLASYIDQLTGNLCFKLINSILKESQTVTHEDIQTLAREAATYSIEILEDIGISPEAKILSPNSGYVKFKNYVKDVIKGHLGSFEDALSY
jgi:hypothetical protein